MDLEGRGRFSKVMRADCQPSQCMMVSLRVLSGASSVHTHSHHSLSTIHASECTHWQRSLPSILSQEYRRILLLPPTRIPHTHEPMKACGCTDASSAFLEHFLSEVDATSPRTSYTPCDIVHPSRHMFPQTQTNKHAHTMSKRVHAFALCSWCHTRT